MITTDQDTVLIVLKKKVCGIALPEMENIAQTQALFTSDKKRAAHTQFRQIMSVKLKKGGSFEIVKAVEQLKKHPLVEHVGANVVGFPSKCGSPVGLNQQYALSKMGIWEAWRITTGSKDTRVGVIDSGACNHSDLSKNLAKGWDFVHGNSNTYDDTLGHGTTIAGIIGAVGREKKVAGVCQHVQIIPLQVVKRDGWFDLVAVIAAIDYAILNDIPILNFCDSSDTHDYTLETAIRNYDGLFVCSAGNNGRNIDLTKRYPPSLNLPNLLCVAATDENDNLLPTSNYGANSVHLAACGANIVTTAPMSRIPLGYKISSGTSVAAPFVTGVAALIKSIDPSMNAASIKETILNNVDIIPALNGKASSGGRLNALKALKAVTVN